MNIGGLQKLSFIDYPDRLAAVVFTQGCNWRCPWCHNPGLLNPATAQPGPGANDVLTFLESRKGRVDAVVITGGEPTLQPDLGDFITALRKLGYPVKLDTNGSRPEVLKDLLEKQLLDFIAMDLKAPPAKCNAAIGTAFAFPTLQRSIDLIGQSGLPHHFRTTVVPGLHEEADAAVLAALIPPASPWIIQAFRPLPTHKTRHPDLPDQPPPPSLLQAFHREAHARTPSIRQIHPKCPEPVPPNT
jgi:pyruvate formate lyase activating enzyme